MDANHLINYKVMSIFTAFVNMRFGSHDPLIEVFRHHDLFSKVWETMQFVDQGFEVRDVLTKVSEDHDILTKF